MVIVAAITSAIGVDLRDVRRLSWATAYMERSRMATPVVVAALIAGSITAVGWLVNHWLVSRREEQRRRIEAQLKYVERQIVELYGPLALLMHEGRTTFADLLHALGRDVIFSASSPLSEDDLRTWLFWTEAEFLPRNEKVRYLLESKAHLVEGPEFPKSYVDFLDHCNSWAINHRRWKEQGVKYSWHSRINWPRRFEEDVLQTFQKLKARHAELVGELF